MVRYELQHGDVWLTDATGASRHVCRGSERMGVAFDAEWGVLYKHGAAREARQWADRKRTEWQQHGMGERAASIVVVEFAPIFEAIEEVNMCIRTTGRILQFEAFLQAFADRHPEIDAPNYPEP